VSMIECRGLLSARSHRIDDLLRLRHGCGGPAAFKRAAILSAARVQLPDKSVVLVSNQRLVSPIHPQTDAQNWRQEPSMTLNGTGIAVFTTSSLSVGGHSITAAYGGDSANRSSTNADRGASGAWSGAEAASGTLNVTPSASGTASYALACTGSGGTANGTATLSVAAASSGKSGGGAMGLWELVALSLLGVAAHRRQRVALQ
jgi:hypothetical protein